MRRIRVIPTLLLNKSGGVVKTVKFGKRTYIGDPINAVKIFNEKSVDEIVILDIDATQKGYPPKFEAIEDIVSEAFMPVAYGGGIQTVDQMAELFRCGVEKVVLSTSAHNSSGIIQEARARFGSQSIVVCLEIKSTLLRKKRVTTSSGGILLKGNPVDFAVQAVNNGAGELLVYSVDRDGTLSGYDIELLKTISNAVDAPVIACGGAKNTDDFVAAVTEANCSAVAAGSMFVYQGAQQGVLISYPSEDELINQFFEKVG